jgi:beta-N-acetylhexosaminidase
MIETLRRLPLRQKVGQLFFIGLGGTELDRPTVELLNEISPGGICLFSRNIKEREQTRALLDGIRTSLPVPPFLSVDQEGGLVDRLRRLMTPMPAAEKLRSAADAGELGAIVAETLRSLGFNMDFAPVVDVVSDARAKFTNGLSSRGLGRSADDVAELAGAFLKALQDGGIRGCLKHFPGLGASQVDSHEELPIVGIPEDELHEVDLAPYRSLMLDTDVVMVAHAAYPDLHLQESDESGAPLPASLSYNVITHLLRGELGFEGLVVTDDLEMGAIVKNYGIAEACKMSLKAGADMLSICAAPGWIREGYTGLLEAISSGEIEEERLDASLTRIAELKSQLSEPIALDPVRLDTLSDAVADLNRRLGVN